MNLCFPIASALTPAEKYRALAGNFDARARETTDGMLKSELASLAASYRCLAEQVDGNSADPDRRPNQFNFDGIRRKNGRF